jgi:hypothetical protein
MSPITSATRPSTSPLPIAARADRRQHTLEAQDAEGSPAGGKIRLGDLLHAFKSHASILLCEGCRPRQHRTAAPAVLAATMNVPELSCAIIWLHCSTTFRRFDRQIAVVRFQGNRRRATSYGKLRGWRTLCRACWPSGALGRATGFCCGEKTAPSGLRPSMAASLRGVLAVPLDAYGTAEFAARVAADVQPKLAVGDALLLGVNCLQNIRSSLSKTGRASCPPKRPGRSRAFARDAAANSVYLRHHRRPQGSGADAWKCAGQRGADRAGAQPYMRWERLLAHPLRFLLTLPLSHVFGQTMGLWVPPIFAAEVHFESRLVAARLIETIKRERISVLAAVPRVMALLKTHLETAIPACRAGGRIGGHRSVEALVALPRCSLASSA